MSAGGELSSAAVTMNVRQTPSPNPRKIGYVQGTVQLESFAVAMSAVSVS